MSLGDVWSLEPHVCRACFGRVASRRADNGDRRLFVCTHCGAEAEGARVSALCACGTRLLRGKGATVDAGLRCHENRARSMEFPAQYVASVGGAQSD